LKNNLVQGFDFDDNDTSPFDSNGHGSHIAGIIAAVTNNGTGISGISKENNIKIMPLKIDLTTAQAIEAINYAKDHGVKVINASWGGPSNDIALESVISLFGGIFVTAAGNSASNHNSINYYPCDFALTNVICVGASNSKDESASFSDYGISDVDVAAPGESIYSAAPYEIFSEDFDDVIPPSLGNKFSNNGPNNTWGTFNSFGSYNFAIGDVSALTNGNYQNNIDSSMVSVPIDLSGKQEASLSFLYDCDTEEGFDGMILNFWNGTVYEAIGSITGKASGVAYVTIDDKFLLPNFKINFRWIADEDTNNYGGCIVSGIKIVDPGSSSGSYQFTSGTSMAAPHVAGEAAMIW
ncbi:MAG TPA: S8 family serine peptidase, partial [Patescibacteria group bacterium]|nr:S8 family serine peptidase [Patescibacteria group bacterium]